MEVLRELALDVAPPQVFGREMKIGVLLYKATGTAQVQTLDDSSLRWVGPWRPSSARSR